MSNTTSGGAPPIEWRTLTAARLRELVFYDPETGIFTRRQSHRGNRYPAGAQIGAVTHHQYLRTTIDGERHYLHRLAFLYMTGSWPDVVDHVDCDGGNNRWSNLRDVTQGVNTQNLRGPRGNNRLGVLGVSFDPVRGRYEASVKLGDTRARRRFDTAAEAHAFYIAQKRELHEGCTL